MRYYIDTNILIFAFHDISELSNDTLEIIRDYSNQILTSTVCISEFIHLVQIGKLNKKKGNDYADKILEWVEDMGIEVVPVSKEHLKRYASLPLFDSHRDPNDRIIIAQAISDNVPLISSDGKFHLYIEHGLDFIYNER